MDERFVKYIEGLLSNEEKTEFEKDLSNDPALEKSYQEFLVLYRDLGDLKLEKRQVPETLHENIMAEVRTLKPTWSCIMSKTKRLWSVSLLVIGLVLVYGLITKSTFFTHQGWYFVIVTAALAAVVFACFPKRIFDSKWYAACTACAIALFSLMESDFSINDVSSFVGKEEVGSDFESIVSYPIRMEEDPELSAELKQQHADNEKTKKEMQRITKKLMKRIEELEKTTAEADELSKFQKRAMDHIAKPFEKSDNDSLKWTGSTYFFGDSAESIPPRIQDPFASSIVGEKSEGEKENKELSADTIKHNTNMLPPFSGKRQLMDGDLLRQSWKRDLRGKETLYDIAHAQVEPGIAYGMVNASSDLNMYRTYKAYNAYINQPFNSEKVSECLGSDGFISPLNEALSTFSIDVDTASYSSARRMINAGTLPYKDDVRIEEFINYFDYDLAKTERKDVPFAVTTELSSAPWKSQHQLLRIGLKGYEEKLENLPPSNLVFLIDVSGSMSPSNRLPLVKQGLNLLVKKLRAEDKVSIVTYANGTDLVLDAVSGNEKRKIEEAINKLYASGGTYGESGIKLAYEVATRNFIKGGNNRVILATDGDFNIGETSDAGLEALIEKERESGVFLSVFGFGMGNYKDSKLETLADKGNGNYGYIDSILEVKKTLLDGITGTLFTIAKDVKIQVEFNPAYVEAYRLIGYENRMLAKEDFNNDMKDAGELGVGHTVTALYEIVPKGVKYQGSVDPLKYQKVEEKKEKEVGVKNNELATVKLRYKLPNEDTSKLITEVVKADSLGNGTVEQNFAAAVAEFGLLLKNSPYKGNASYENVINLAKKSFGADENGDRHEFVKLVEKAELMAK